MVSIPGRRGMKTKRKEEDKKSEKTEAHLLVCRHRLVPVPPCTHADTTLPDLFV